MGFASQEWLGTAMRCDADGGKMTSEKNIRIEKNAAVILSTILAFRGDLESTRRTTKTLSIWCGLAESDVRAALEYAREDGLAYRVHRDHDWGITLEGEEWLKGLSMNPYFQISILRWRDEVLTGITAQGRETDIENPVVPGFSSSAVVTDPEIRFHNVVQALGLAEELGLTFSEFRSVSQEGRVRPCRGYGRQRPHIGIFDLRDGRPRELCQRCLRRKRADLRRAKSNPPTESTSSEPQSRLPGPASRS
jgi:hypothetical protein